jgi:hypothetical protein
MPYVHTGTNEITEVGVQLLSNAPIRVDGKEHYATWVHFRFCDVNRDIDLRLVSTGEANLRGYLGRTEEAERKLDKVFGDMFADAAHEFTSEVKKLKRKGHGDFRIVIGSMNGNLRSERAVSEGACVTLPYADIEAAAKNGTFTSLVETAKNVFHALNNRSVAWKLQALEDRKISGHLRLWQTHVQPDGHPFAYAFSATDEAAVVLVTQADQKAMPGSRLGYAVTPDLNIGLLAQPDAKVSSDAPRLDAGQAVEALRAKGLLKAVEGLPLRVVETVYEHSAKFQMVSRDSEDDGQVIPDEERETILRFMTTSLSLLGDAKIQAISVEQGQSHHPRP